MTGATDARLLGIFREEASERLDRLVATLLAIDAGTPPADATDILFREFHSLKGGAGLVGLERLRDVAHAVEEQLGGWRRAGEPVPREMAGPLMATADELRRMLADDAPDRAVAERPARDEPPAAAPAPAATAAPADQSIRVSAAKVDRVLDTVGSAVLHQRGLEHLLGAQVDEPVEEALDQGAVLLDELQDAAIELRALPLSAITGRLPRHVRDLAVAEGKEIDLELHGVDTQLDRTILDGLSDTLVHLLRNAVAHGIEPAREREAAGKPPRGRVELRAEQRGARIAIEVTDDGRGVAADVLRDATGNGDGALAELLAQPGFSTAGHVSEVAGRGVGLDAVKAHVESLGGSVEARSTTGRGTTVTLLLPLTLAILHVLLVEHRGQPFGLPLGSVEEIVVAERTTALGGRASIVVRGEAIPLGDLAVALGGAAGPLPERPPALVVTHGATTVALACDRLLDEQDVVVKRLGPLLERRAGYLGGAILGDGRVALIVDPAVAVERAAAAAAATAHAPLAATGDEPAGGGPALARTVLVVDDQFTVRELQRSILEAAGYRVTTAVDGRDALRQLETEAEVDAIVTDLEMPELDGFELLRRVREQPALASLPVVVVTSLTGDEERRRGLEAGADAYVTKDRFDQRALLDTVERLIGR